MKELKYFLALYFLISGIIISNTYNIVENAFPNYPKIEHLNNEFNKYLKIINPDISFHEILESMPPEDLYRIGRNIASFVNSCKKAGDFCKNILNIFPETINKFIKNSQLAFSLSFYFIKNHCMEIGVGIGIAACIGTFIKYNLKILNDENNKIILVIKKFFLNKKYKDIVNKEIGTELDNILEKSLESNLESYIKELLSKGNKLDELNSIFNKKIDSLTFILIGKSRVGKSTLINAILGLQSGVDGAFVNEEEALSTTLDFHTYNNNSKKGIELIDTRGFETNIHFTSQDFVRNYIHFFKSNIMHDNTHFIYSFIFVADSRLFGENEALINLMGQHYDKIPLRIISQISEDEDENKRLKNSIIKKMQKENIKIIFLGHKKNHKYEEKIEYFLKDLLNELKVEKLKDIYQYYYSLNVIELVNNITKNNSNTENVYASIPLKTNQNPIEYLSAKLQLDIHFLLLKEINLDYSKMNEILNSLYNRVFKELKNDIKNSEYKDFSLKKEDEEGFFQRLKNKMINGPLPKDVISFEISGIINTLINEIFLQKIEKKLIEKKLLKIEIFPDFSFIRQNIEKNYFNQLKKNNIPTNKGINQNTTSVITRNNSGNSEKTFIIVWDSWIFIIIFIIVLILMLFIIKYCCIKRDEKNDNDKYEEMKFIEPRPEKR